MFIEEFLFPAGNSCLSARIYSNNTKTEQGILFSHGLFSSKDGYKITRLARNIVSCGYNLMTFNFSSAENFVSEKRSISITGQVHELEYAAAEFQRRGIRRLHLMGSSMGAAVSILFAAGSEHPPESLILIAAPLELLSVIPGMTPEKAFKLDDSGFSEISGILVNNAFFKEMAGISILDAVKKINSPVLLIHGKKDNVVDFSNFELFISNCRAECMQLVIDDGDHNLTRDKDLALISEKTVEWLGKFNA